MAGKKVETNVAITNTQERWQELAKGVDSHAALLVQLSDIVEKFQATDAVFSDFKKAQQTVLSLEKQIAQQREAIEALRTTVEEVQNRDAMSESVSESLKLEWNAALKQAAAQTHDALQSTKDDLTQMRNALQFVRDDLTTKLQQYAENFTDLQKTVDALQQRTLVDSRTSSSLETELSTLRQSTVQTNSALQSLKDNMTSVKSTRAHLQKLRNLTSVAIVFGCLSFALSVFAFLR